MTAETQTMEWWQEALKQVPCESGSVHRLEFALIRGRVAVVCSGCPGKSWHFVPKSDEDEDD